MVYQLRVLREKKISETPQINFGAPYARGSKKHGMSREIRYEHRTNLCLYALEPPWRANSIYVRYVSLRQKLSPGGQKV